ncbi:ATP-dependent Clp protease ATP-binding subunit ClpE [Carnobacterium iners]|uniref:ATP-dependent Clp protease ATP-binding subunit ClpE n=1 Tax=Carnobacterium iners TaxID=1073423 RepID=A0A1X7NR33_9LACT|nr:ATP-dependent Clp protease ATP-binding subunit [Carnobacterium iners]SEK29454.1 ATP-dependent Clp protease ATP-binding subunit ClpE [Carnobacterium iners]SMH39754.1 ATP-dependent Clp protease ATP-binding subunit ClpE [Carnobacterium iners]
MLCQNCQQLDANIHLYTNMNGQKGQLDICQNCYNLLKEANGKGNRQDNRQTLQEPFGISNLDDFFRSISLPERGNQNTPSNKNNGYNESVYPPTNKIGGLLGEFGINVTTLARDGAIDPVIGRDNEINRVIEILNRRTKNNPVLIGEPGVGKTAIVEGLALKIIDAEVPEKLMNKQVIQLDVASLVQGTGVRGQFEERMQQLMDEMKKNPKVILFIDEVHEIVGAGSAEGSMDAGNMLKPALARGELQMVGATTLKEYRSIEKDAALERRLQPVQVREPSIKETIDILEGIKSKYEDYHQVSYTDEAIKNAVLLSSRYIQDRFLPDKAIDLLDESGSKKNLTIKVMDPKLIEDKLVETAQQKQAALKEEDYEKAAFYRDQAIKLAAMREKQTIQSQERPIVTEKDMVQIIETKTNIPVGELKAKEQSQLKSLESDLRKQVIGQNQAIEKISKAIRRSRIGLNKKNRPIGSFLFVGPTGVGKTELAKQLALEMFGNKEAHIRFDMSEYMEKHSVSKLIGSPPGYVGYDEAGQLTEKVRRNPYSILLLDEIEKAHPDVLHMFLQILEDGRLTDAQGRTVSFKDTIIIMTSSAGSGSIEANVGFSAATKGNQKSVLNHLTDFFKPEFINRFDAIVEFNTLEYEHLLVIVDLMLRDVNEMLKDQGISLEVDQLAKKKLVDLGYDLQLGARPLRRVIQEQIEDRIADFYIDYPEIKDLLASINDKGDIILTSKEEVSAFTKANQTTN